MHSIWAFLVAHQTASTLTAFWILSAAIGSLQMPDATSGKFYKWFFSFSNAIAANVSRVVASFQKGAADATPPKP